MNETSDLLYDRDDGVATLTLNRPAERNAFGDATRAALRLALERAAQDRGVRCVIITGAGEAFSAGGDIKGMVALQERDDTEVLRERLIAAAAVVTQIRALEVPVIAAINGAAAGGGLNLALACDIRYAADTAVFSQSFVKIGLIPDWGGHYLLTRIVGSGRALELMMLGERFDAATALRLGIVNDVLPRAIFLDTVRARARALARGPRAALAAIKRGVYLGAEGTLEQTLAYEQATQLELFLSGDAREGMRAFVEKRPPAFTDDARLPLDDSDT